ncbi:hypothetical protein BGW36DRAFT_359598 [Talaromyces proteolyticus]|uniref:IBR domain-containing protein n=1 Tax=Talaromyces proteolyticus TaxID=1131652 RepID=A0AAD4KQ61_9EURO|nr:uncharacterized protein BGW36DRAFT_359598 [Talaromyces proteolyticus]KAH8697823.1 hypothetical protein BGW36DRAFT_359598 [Talaromyces proteolyticus]
MEAEKGALAHPPSYTEVTNTSIFEQWKETESKLVALLVFDRKSRRIFANLFPDSSHENSISFANGYGRNYGQKQFEGVPYWLDLPMKKQDEKCQFSRSTASQLEGKSSSSSKEKTLCAGCNTAKNDFEIVRLVNRSLFDETKFPTKCCRLALQTQDIESLVNELTAHTYRLTCIEHNDKNPTYCSKGTCSRYVLSEYIKGKTALCQECDMETCILCKSAAHAEKECPGNGDFREILALAKEKGWKQCFNCRRLVERIGCWDDIK